MANESLIRRFSTDSAEKAQSFLAPSLAECRILEVVPSSSFRFDMEAVRFGKTLLMRNRYATACRIRSVLRWDDMLFVAGEGEAVAHRVDHRLHFLSLANIPKVTTNEH